MNFDAFCKCFKKHKLCNIWLYSNRAIHNSTYPLRRWMIEDFRCVTHNVPELIKILELVLICHIFIGCNLKNVLSFLTKFTPALKSIEMIEALVAVALAYFYILVTPEICRVAKSAGPNEVSIFMYRSEAIKLLFPTFANQRIFIKQSWSRRKLHGLREAVK